MAVLSRKGKFEDCAMHILPQPSRFVTEPVLFGKKTLPSLASMNRGSIFWRGRFVDERNES